ncbi:MAG: ribosome silencing factor [Atopobium sp.]|uniref:ribosome silencing factor n=1 Tax=Atopobium sp. TaxID=1872650 RepID=UPI002A755AB3|nr:ribosome silencing factor [Atopobium sp.]MDY2788650.1 ribosome silencing factor [Atopobium sp.]
MSVTPLELAKVAAAAANEKKIEELVLIDVSEISDICDYFLIGTAANARLADSVIDEIEEKVGINCAEKPISIEGREDKTWILMDYGVVLVNIFLPEQRDFYRLDKLWGDAPVVALSLD